ncbi:MAG: hypothetical protein ABI333_26630 [bacterium]
MLTQISETRSESRPRRSTASSAVVAALVVLAAAAATSCGPVEILEGGTRAALPAKSQRVYRVTKCTLAKSFKEVKLKHPIWYHLGEDSAGPVVYERSHKGTVFVFQNRWTHGDGYHFLVLVIGGPYAYEIVVPWDPQKPAVRRVWARNDISAHEGSWQPAPKAVPHAACPMELEGRKSPAVRATPRAAPPPERRVAKPRVTITSVVPHRTEPRGTEPRRAEPHRAPPQRAPE